MNKIIYHDQRYLTKMSVAERIYLNVLLCTYIIRPQTILKSSGPDSKTRNHVAVSLMHKLLVINEARDSPNLTVSQG